ncbi:MAG: hypothetical protein K0R62_3685 [Nonomuraea muscovyensis]|nr:hypothetical protein [Nonomuraea muscovyensis]
MLAALSRNCWVAWFSMRVRTWISASSMQPKSPRESGSMTTTAGRSPMPAANSEIHVRYAASLPAPPPECPPQASRPGML